MAQTLLEGQLADQQQPWGWQGKNTRHLLDLTTKVRLLFKASLSSILCTWMHASYTFDSSQSLRSCLFPSGRTAQCVHFCIPLTFCSSVLNPALL